MTDSGLPRFLAIHFLFQGSQAQRERLRAIFVPSSCSNLYSSTSVRTSEFAIHPWTGGSAIQSVTSPLFLWQYTKSNIMQDHENSVCTSGRSKMLRKVMLSLGGLNLNGLCEGPMAQICTAR